MSDFVIQVGQRCDTARIAAVLRDREHLAARDIVAHTTPWGSVVAQGCRCLGYERYEADGVLHLCVGRPREVGWTHEDDGPQAFMRRWGPRVQRGVDAAQYDRLTGTYALVAVADQGVRILTDRIGMYPVYVGVAADTARICVIGSHPELVAECAGRREDVDLLSVAEILLRHNVTYPHTTRNGVREIEPGSYHTFVIDADTGVTRHEVDGLWIPAEPSRWPSLRQSRDALEAAMRFAGTDIVRGAERVVATLSGGLDSRAVIGALPRERLVGAVTFINNENHECRIAGRIAATAGLPHLHALRDPEFYATLPERESSLVGMERAAVHAHALAVADSGLMDQFDLMVGGFFCDTLLKGYFAQESVRALLAARLGVPRAQRLRWFAEHFNWFTYNKAIVTTVFRPEILEGMRVRIEARLAEIRAYRPETAEEWLMFYPQSKNEGANYSLVNTRIFPADELFLHRDIVNVAASAHQLHKLNKQLVTPVFARLAGPLAKLPNANTGVAADAGWWRKVLHRRMQRLRGRKKPTPRYEYPWFADHSWIDYQTFQRVAPRWQALRRRALECPAGLAVLAGVLKDDPRSYIETFHEPLGNRLDYKLIQTALHFERAAQGALSGATVTTHDALKGG